MEVSRKTIQTFSTLRFMPLIVQMLVVIEVYQLSVRTYAHAESKAHIFEECEY